MRARMLAGLLSAATGFVPLLGHAAAPTLEFSEGPLASVPITSGAVSGGGFTATGAQELAGGSTLLQFGGTPSLNVVPPLQIQVTEYNLTSLGALASFTAAISGMLQPRSSLSWAAYVDPNNAPLGTTDLIASNTFTDLSTVEPAGFDDSLQAVAGLTGPFSLTEIFSLSSANVGAVTFSSSIGGTADAIPEPGPLAVLGIGMMGLGGVLSRRRRATPVTTGPVENY